MSSRIFQYYEVRPVIEEADRECISFTDEGDFQAEAARRRAAGEDIQTFWTIYGIDAEGLSLAVCDMSKKEDAQGALHAMLAPMAAARDLLDAGSRGHTGTEELRRRIEKASALLEDFINQCSNEERI